MIVKFYKQDKNGRKYLGEKEMNIIPREREFVEYGINYGFIIMVRWDVDIDCVTILLK